MKTPILVTCLRVYAVLQILAGMACLGLAIKDANGLIAGASIVGTALATILTLGAAQCVHYLAACAHHAEESAESLQFIGRMAYNNNKTK